MDIEVSLSRSAHETIYIQWPSEIRELVEDGLNSLSSIEPHKAKIAPSPPYPIHMGHYAGFRVKHEGKHQYINAFFVFSDDLKQLHITSVTAIPGFREQVPIAFDDGDEEVIEIPS